MNGLGQVLTRGRKEMIAGPGNEEIPAFPLFPLYPPQGIWAYFSKAWS